jgi:hypothetical protein
MGRCPVSGQFRPRRLKGVLLQRLKGVLRAARLRPRGPPCCRDDYNDGQFEPAAFDPCARRRRGLPPGEARVGGGTMAGAAGDGALPVCGRDQHRHADAVGHGVAQRPLRSEFHRREPPRCERQHRGRSGRQSGARRLHAAHRDGWADRQQQVHVQKSGFRSRPRFRVDRVARLFAAHHRRQPEAAGDEPDGALRLRQRASRPARRRNRRGRRTSRSN